MAWYSRRTYGDVVDNGLAMLHNKPILKAGARLRAPRRQVGPPRPGPEARSRKRAAPR